MVYQNLRKYWRRRGMVARMMERTIEMVRDQGAMYTIVAQSVILYRSKIWVMTG